jgi:hypothetical protein
MDRLLCYLLILLVGAWGFEPQTPTVSRQRSAKTIPNYNGVFTTFKTKPDQLPDQLIFLLILCYICLSFPPLIHVEAQPQPHSNTKDLR